MNQLSVRVSSFPSRRLAKVHSSYLKLAFSIFFVMAAAAPILSACSKSMEKDLALESYLKAKEYYAKGDLDLAGPLLRHACRKNPDMYQAHFLLGKTLFFLENYEEAERILLELVDRHPAYHEAEIWLVRTHLQRKSYERAEDRLKRLLSYDSGDPRLHYLMAQIYLLKDDLKNAIDFLQRAAVFNEEMAKIHLELGRIYFQFGLDGKALSELEHSLFLLPEENTLRQPVLHLISKISSIDAEP